MIKINSIVPHTVVYTNIKFKKELPKIVKALFKRAEKFGEAELDFGEDRYIRITNDLYSYIDLGTGGCRTLMKRSQKDIVYILIEGLLGK